MRIDKEEILLIHARLIDKYGGSNGLRDEAALESALARPFAAFGGEDFYPNAIEKAAALMQSIIQNHPFIDGNKRTGYFSAMLLLLDYGYDTEATETERYDFVIEIASGKLDYEGIVAWLKEKVIAVK